MVKPVLYHSSYCANSKRLLENIREHFDVNTITFLDVSTQRGNHRGSPKSPYCRKTVLYKDEHTSETNYSTDPRVQYRRKHKLLDNRSSQNWMNMTLEPVSTVGYHAHYEQTRIHDPHAERYVWHRRRIPNGSISTTKHHCLISLAIRRWVRCPKAWTTKSISTRLNAWF
jgi:hypothetical protein